MSIHSHKLRFPFCNSVAIIFIKNYLELIKQVVSLIYQKRNDMKKIGIIGAGAAIATALAMTPNAQLVTTSEAQSQHAQQNQQRKNDAIVVDNQLPAIPIQMRQGLTLNFSSNPGESRFLNQRQYRKKVRSNPCLYKSRKHRSKN